MKLLIGGSPCTFWSIAQKQNRETEASGQGWELFCNYRIARDKYRPDYFLYENNKSMSAAIRAKITEELGVEPVLINSALVSAQNRERLYWVGKRNDDGTYSTVAVPQPQDRGILLRDVLESGVCWREKAYTLRASADTKQGVSNIIRHIETNGKYGYQGVAEPVGIKHLGSLYGQHSRWGIFDTEGKAPTLTASAGMGGGHVPMYAEPVGVGYRNRRESDGKLHRRFETHGEAKSNALTTVQTDSMVAEPIRIGTIDSDAKNAAFDSQQYRVYSPDGKSVTLCGNGGGVGAKTGLYAVPTDKQTPPRLRSA